MAYSKDIERLARSLHGQKLDPEYIRHYLAETYQMDAKAVDDLLERIGLPRKPVSGKAAAKPAGKAEKPAPRQNFY